VKSKPFHVDRSARQYTEAVVLAVRKKSYWAYRDGSIVGSEVVVMPREELFALIRYNGYEWDEVNLVWYIEG